MDPYQKVSSLFEEANAEQMHSCSIIGDIKQGSISLDVSCIVQRFQIPAAFTFKLGCI